jgi:hypothetical protein
MIDLIFIEEADIEALFSENLISEFCETLAQFKALDFAIFFFKFIGNLIGTLGTKPLICPFF